MLGYKLMLRAFTVVALSTLTTQLEQGRMSKTIQRGEMAAFTETMYAGAEMKIGVDMLNCTNDSELTLKWVVRSTSCFAEYSNVTNNRKELDLYMSSPFLKLPAGGEGVFLRNREEGVTIHCGENWKTVHFSAQNWTEFPGDTEETKDADQAGKVKREVKRFAVEKRAHGDISNQLVAVLPYNAPYLVVVSVESDSNFSCTVNVEVKGPHGYLSPLQYPLYLGYLVSAAAYILYVLAWLILCAAHSRQLKCVHRWIGVVVLLAMAESIVMCFQYLAIKWNGKSGQALTVVCIAISAITRSCARILFVVLSLGGGAIKPLGRVASFFLATIGLLFFVFACIGDVVQIKELDLNKLLVSQIPLACIDIVVCMWIIAGLVTTMKFLRNHENLELLSRYRRFAVMLFICVVAAVLLVIWSNYRHDSCTGEWSTLWADTALWKVIFLVALTYIMIAWRPKSRHRKYTFAHLTEDVDSEDDEEDGIEESST